MILLVNPPVSKPCEPPAGLCQLAGALASHSIPYRLLDINLEGILSLLQTPREASDTWTRRAEKHLIPYLKSLRDIDFYNKFDSYKRALSDVNRLLATSAREGIRISLEDYEDASLSPVKSNDLVRAAENPEHNPFYPYFSQRLSDVIEKENPRLIGFSLTYLSQALCCFAMMGFVKKHFPNLPIVIGGGLVTSWSTINQAPSTLEPFGSFHGLADHIIAGPGEGPLLSILGKEFRKDLPYRPVYNWDSVNSYLSPGLIMPYSTSSGCWWGKCSFCPERAEGNKYVQRPSSIVASDLKNLAEETKPALIHLTDNAVSPAILSRLAKEPPGAPWYGFVRITEDLTDPNFCMTLRNAGCVMLKLGVESGHEGVLEYMQKGLHPSTTARALKALSEAGIATYIYLLLGTPYESEKEARTTLDFIVRQSPFIDFMNIAIFNLPLQSPDSRDLLLADFYEGDLSLYADFQHPKGWDRRAVRRFLDNEFKKHSAIKPILLRQPPFLTSNHAPFFTKGFQK